MQIYFDDILIDPDNYMSYEDNFSSHEDQFFLGSTASMNAKLQIPLSVYRDDIQNVIIINNGITIATLKIDEVSIDDDNIVTLREKFKKRGQKNADGSFFYSSVPIPIPSTGP